MKTNDAADVLRNLIQTLEDGKDGFRLAADAIDNSDLCRSRYNTPWGRKAWKSRRRTTKSAICADLPKTCKLAATGEFVRQKDGRRLFLRYTMHTMSPEEQPDDRPRREKENMDEPQEEFIDISSVPSHPKHAPPEPDTTEEARKNGT